MLKIKECNSKIDQRIALTLTFIIMIIIMIHGYNLTIISSESAYAQNLGTENGNITVERNITYTNRTNENIIETDILGVNNESIAYIIFLKKSDYQTNPFEYSRSIAKELSNIGLNVTSFPERGILIVEASPESTAFDILQNNPNVDSLAPINQEKNTTKPIVNTTESSINNTFEDYSCANIKGGC
jgi:hypothetical protein